LIFYRDEEEEEEKLRKKSGFVLIDLGRLPRKTKRQDRR
jgi:hypothetical protein